MHHAGGFQAVVLVIGVILAPVSGTPAAEEHFVLASPDTSTALITRSGWEQARWDDWGGHAILRRYVELATGVRLPVMAADVMADAEARQRYDYRVWVGRQPEVDRVIGDELDALDDDGFIIHCAGRDLYLSGKFWWGTNWAAYDVLERFAGFRRYLMGPRWWRPDEDGILGPGDILPAGKSITLPADNHIVEEPDYKSRWFRTVPQYNFRVRRRDHFHHALRSIVPPSKYFEAHSEWYPKIEGERERPRNANDFQPCATNAQVTEFVSNHIIQHFRDHPEESSFSIGMNDTGRFCECADCLAAAPDAIKGRPERIAWAFWQFYNRIAERVAEDFPDERLGCLAYAGLRCLPAGSIELHPMIVPYLTLDSAQLHDPAQVREFRQSLQKWLGFAGRMGVYEYMYGGGFVIPRIYNRYLAKNIKERYGAGVDGFYAEAYPNWGLDGPKYWLVSELLWDTDADPDALLGRFYDDMFGPAADEMKAYFDYLEEVWCTQTPESDRSNYRWLRDPKQLEIFPPEKCDHAWGLLQEAQKAAPDDVVRERIRFFKTSFALTRVLSARYAAATKANELAAEEPLDIPRVLAGLEGWLGAGDVQEAVAAVRALGFAAFSTTGRDELDHISYYDRRPNAALETVVSELSRRAVTGREFARLDQVRQAARGALSAVAGPDSGAAVGLVEELLAERGVLFIPRCQTPPRIDGQLREGEWGEPIFVGNFFPATHAPGGAATLIQKRVPEVTAIYALYEDEALYLAFRAEQAPETTGADVADRDTTAWRDPDMRRDDCIVFNFRRQGARWQQVRVNANGAVSDHASGNLDWDVTTAAAGRSDEGWQVEMRLDMRSLNINPSSAQKALPRMCVARYTRRPAPGTEGEFETEVSSLLPFAPGRGIIGYGNHPHLMTFVTGPWLVFEKPAGKGG